MPRKITDKDFIDWENYFFGYGYGSGEQHTLPAMRKFLSLCSDSVGTTYDFEVLEKELGGPVTWLLINFFAHARMIEYGSSPRYAWLTEKGRLLREYILSKNLEELYDLVVDTHENYVYCLPNYCGCDWKEKVKTCNRLF